jgi:hypothetical protein
MYVIDKQTNRIAKLENRTFNELGFGERGNLQEWLAHAPSALGEDLLIIQKEFNGFEDTRERLDLLALDKDGNLVLIENKLDDSGRDVTWQALKYASYCSTLKKEDIRSIYQQYLDRWEQGSKAEDRLTEFMEKADYESLSLNEGTKQRIILVAAQFRKEVTSTVLWLMNYGIHIKCFKVTPFQLGDQPLLNVEQVLPTQDMEDFIIRMASKAKDELAAHEEERAKNPLRLEFWSYFLQEAQGKSNLFTNISPAKDNWIGLALGMTGVSMNLVVSNKMCRAEVYINRGDKSENKVCFDFLLAQKDTIEKAFGAPLEWERMDDRVTCRIRYGLLNVDLYDREDWDRMTEFMLDAAQRMHKAFKGPVKELNDELRKRS